MMKYICYICLRTDKTLQFIPRNLADFHTNISSSTNKDLALFCLECAINLKKFYEFRQQCVLARKTFENWQNKSGNNRSLEHLHKLMPPPRLSLCNRNNCKVYSYKDETVSEEPMATSTAKRHILANDSGNINGNPWMEIQLEEDNVLTVKVVNEVAVKENNVGSIQESFDNVSVDDFDSNEMAVKENRVGSIQESLDNVSVDDLDSNDSVSIQDEDNDNDTNDSDIDEPTQAIFLRVNVENESTKTDVDTEISSTSTAKRNDVDNNMISTKPSVNGTKKKVIKEKKKMLRKRNVKRTKLSDLDKLRLSLEAISDNYGDVKDEDGMLIDIDGLVTVLDKIPVLKRKQMWNLLKDSSTLKPKAIKVLSQLQKIYKMKEYESIFIIEQCSTEEQVLELFLKRQHEESYTMAKYKCELCYRGFVHQRRFDYHNKMSHNDEFPYVCTLCQVRVQTPRALVSHRNLHRLFFKCKLCPLWTNYKDVMKNHYNQHKGMVYACKLCEKTFKSSSSLHGHQQSVHDSKHVCDICTRSFVSEQGLRRHFVVKHKDEDKAYTEKKLTRSRPKRKTTESYVKNCDICDLEFASGEDYQIHMLKLHPQKVYIEHDEFGAQRVTYVRSRKTRKTIGRPRSYTCRLCFETGKSVDWLRNHFATEHPNDVLDVAYRQKRSHLCDICGKSFQAIPALNDHKNTHTGAKPYACVLCPKKFSGRVHLKGHLEFHRPPTRECPICGKKFYSSANLCCHMKVHAGIRRYTCEVCGKSFLHSCALKEHVRGVHFQIRRARKSALKDE